MASVLIVENNHFFRRSFKEILKMYIPSLLIRESADGAEALQKIRAEVPDLVFMDIRLPGINGLDLARQIKDRYPDVVVSIFTHYDFPEYRVIAAKYGADHFLLKDKLSGAEIADIVRSVVSDKQRRAKKKRRLGMGGVKLAVLSPAATVA